MDKRDLPRIEGRLRSKYIEVPKEIYKAKGTVKAYAFTVPFCFVYFIKSVG